VVEADWNVNWLSNKWSILIINFAYRLTGVEGNLMKYFIRGRQNCY
jgi:hypothetical protein